MLTGTASNRAFTKIKNIHLPYAELEEEINYIMLLSFSFNSKGNLSSSLQSIWSRVVTRQVGNGCLKPSDQIDLIFIIRYNMKDRINLKMK